MNVSATGMAMCACGDQSDLKRHPSVVLPVWSIRLQRLLLSPTQTFGESIQRGNAGMNMIGFLKTVRRGIYRSALPALAIGTAAFPGSAAADEALVTNVGRFEIPFEVEADPGSRPQGFAVLFGSQDGGRTWDRLNTVPAANGSFTFSAPRDGHYSFAIRTTDAQGNLQQAIQGSPPELEVIVDTVAPDIRLDLLDAGNGQFQINWITQDASVVPQTLVIEFADGTDGRWKPVRLIPASSGQAMAQALAGSVVSVRASVQDAAGNRGESTSQVVLRPAGSTSNVVPANPYANSGTAAPLGPSPFPQMNSFANRPAPSSNPLTIPANEDALNMPPGQPVPGEFSSQPTIGVSPAARYAPPANLMKEVSYQAVAGAQVVNRHIFDLEYQVDDVGPSGVSAVELFVTEDGGANWFTYGNDEDVHSPVLIDTRGEGTFGFAVRVRNGLGFADDAPQPGQTPEMVVTIDETQPTIEMSQPVMRTDGFGTIQLSWRVTDKNPASTPVRLEYAAAPNGPWTPVFDWQFDQSGYQWGVRPGTPTQLYFRLLARDAAGNVASAQTSQPVVVDLRRPVGRLLRVQPVSQPTK
ncbi:MAG TPA: hypothetical protein PLR25_25550 [Planctomycetaceae bacterium]|nr:hypothetical protein [Planctomycetaceae bacterium]